MSIFRFYTFEKYRYVTYQLKGNLIQIYDMFKDLKNTCIHILLLNLIFIIYHNIVKRSQR